MIGIKLPKLTKSVNTSPKVDFMEIEMVNLLLSLQILTSKNSKVLTFQFQKLIQC